MSQMGHRNRAFRGSQRIPMSAMPRADLTDQRNTFESATKAEEVCHGYVRTVDGSAAS